jgi:antitoxin (DNA-binding transcriptional repressor) of toxin-antitoxin stability system
MYKVTLDEARTRLPELIRAALRGETVLIAQDDERAVQLVPVTRSTHGKTGSAKGAVVTTSVDFEAPPDEDDCEEYLAKDAG